MERVAVAEARRGMGVLVVAVAISLALLGSITWMRWNAAQRAALTSAPTSSLAGQPADEAWRVISPRLRLEGVEARRYITPTLALDVEARRIISPTLSLQQPEALS